MAHEKSITIESDGKIYNIPSVVKGKQLSAAQAFQHFKKTRRHFGSFKKMQGALFSAGKRSRFGHGRERPLLKKTRVWDARFLRSRGRRKPKGLGRK